MTQTRFQKNHTLELLKSFKPSSHLGTAQKIKTSFIGYSSRKFEFGQKS